MAFTPFPSLPRRRRKSEWTSETSGKRMGISKLFARTEILPEVIQKVNVKDGKRK